MDVIFFYFRWVYKNCFINVWKWCYGWGYRSLEDMFIWINGGDINIWVNRYDC